MGRTEITLPGVSAVTVPLGEVRTDPDDRLLVLGASGAADSPTGDPIVGFLNNPGWYDDVSDGPVIANVTVKATGDTQWVRNVFGAHAWADPVYDQMMAFDIFQRLKVPLRRRQQHASAQSGGTDTNPTRLADRFRLIAPDFRGFGESDNPHPEPSDQVGADLHANDMLALMDALSLERAGFVGHDIGAYVMQSLARRHPMRMSRLLFFNCPTHGVGARWRDPEHINQIWYQTFHQMPYAADIVGATRENCRAHIGHFLRHWSHRKDVFDEVLERWVDNFMRPGNLQGGFNFYRSQNAPRLAVMAGTAPKPEKIQVPARVVWGRHDPILKAAWADVLPEAFEDVSVDFAEDCGHFVHYENPDRAAQEIAAFFA